MRLRECGFEDAPRSRLGLAASRDVMEAVLGVRSPRSPRTDEGADALDLLVALFFFGERVPQERVDGALGPETVAAFEEMQLASAEDGFLAPNALLFPCDGMLVATDLLEEEGGANIVMPLFAESYDLATVTVRSPVPRALDLCTGSGVHALLASRHADEVVGVDLNRRATAFARFNAWLNEIENARFLEGDLYAPVEGGGRFALITANPPYNPELDSAPGEDHHSGGDSGEEVLARIVAGLPGHLADDGCAQIITLLVHRQGDDLEARIRRWLGDRGQRIDVLVLARPVAYGPHVLAGAADLSPGERALHESWRRQRIVRFEFGVLNFRRVRGRPAVFRRGPFGDRAGPGRIDVASAMDALPSRSSR